MCRKALVGYRIHDPLLAIRVYDHPAVAILGYAQAQLSKGCTASEVKAGLGVAFKDSGVAVEFVELSEDVEVPAFRLLQENWTLSSEHYKNKKGRY